MYSVDKSQKIFPVILENEKPLKYLELFMDFYLPDTHYCNSFHPYRHCIAIIHFQMIVSKGV